VALSSTAALSADTELTKNSHTQIRNYYSKSLKDMLPINSKL